VDKVLPARIRPLLTIGVGLFKVSDLNKVLNTPFVFPAAKPAGLGRHSDYYTNNQRAVRTSLGLLLGMFHPGHYRVRVLRCLIEP